MPFTLINLSESIPRPLIEDVNPLLPYPGKHDAIEKCCNLVKSSLQDSFRECRSADYNLVECPMFLYTFLTSYIAVVEDPEPVKRLEKSSRSRGLQKVIQLFNKLDLAFEDNCCQRWHETPETHSAAIVYQ